MKVDLSTELRVNAAGFDPGQPRDEEGQWTEHPGDLNVKVLSDLPNSTGGVPAEKVGADLGGETELDIQLPSVSSASTIQPADYDDVLAELGDIASGELGTQIDKIRNGDDLTKAEVASMADYLDSELGSGGLLELKHLVDDNLMDKADAKKIRSQASKLRTKLRKIS